jgi:ABC-type bacteriocin/lantibiotic exporter with double-glycine peptidase domain
VSLKIKNSKISALSILRKTYSHLEDQRKREIRFVLYLTMLSTLAESVSIAMLVPFVSFFINPENYLFNSLFESIFNFLKINNQKDILGIIGIGFILIIILSSFIKLLHIKFSNLLSEEITSDFRIKIFKFLINQDFSYHFKYGSNEIMSNLSQKASSFIGIIFSTMNIVNSVLISLGIIIVLTINEPVFTPIIIFSIILFFFIFYMIKSKLVFKKGQTVNLNQNYMIDVFQNTVGYLPEIIVYNIKNFFLKTLKKFSHDVAISSSEVRTIAMSPRIYLEAFVISFVVLFIHLSNFSERSIEINISYLAILAFGTQKCIPLINNIYNLSINFKGASPSAISFLEILERKTPNVITDEKHETLSFKKTIKLKEIFFYYNKSSPSILNNFNFEINKGEKIIIKGKTGSGKSTLVNIISGLLNPSKGKVYVDDIMIDSENLKKWQKNIAIVPQTVFLNDASVMENIAIAHDKSNIDLEKVKISAKLAQVDAFIESLSKKYNERVGERGVKLSGGQKQRIGIARALYRDANVIILDEPTNALDFETEKLVMDSITKLNKDITVIMISHSGTSAEYFDKIIDLNKYK